MLELCVSHNKNQFGKSCDAAFSQFPFVFLSLPALRSRIRSGKHRITEENTRERENQSRKKVRRLADGEGNCSKTFENKKTVLARFCRL